MLKSCTQKMPLKKTCNVVNVVPQSINIRHRYLPVEHTTRPIRYELNSILSVVLRNGNLSLDVRILRPRPLLSFCERWRYSLDKIQLFVLQATLSYLKYVKKVNLSWHLLQFFVVEVIALACNFCSDLLYISSQFAQNLTRLIRFFFVLF